MKFVLIILGLMIVSAEMLTANHFDVIETFPEKSTVLSVQDEAYLRIRYQSMEPTRFVVKAFRQGKEIENFFRSNPQPLYPKGEGEALAWVRMVGASQVETLLIQSFNSNWKKLGERKIDVQWSWVETFLHKENLVKPSWVERLKAIQGQMIRDQIDQEGRRENFVQKNILDILYFMFFIYLIMQVYVAISMKGSLRRRVMVPLALFVPAILYSGAAYFAGSDLWPMALLLAAPFAFLYLCFLVLWKKKARV